MSQQQSRFGLISSTQQKDFVDSYVSAKSLCDNSFGHVLNYLLHVFHQMSVDVLALAHLIWCRDTDKGIARAPSTRQTINSST